MDFPLKTRPIPWKSRPTRSAENERAINDGEGHCCEKNNSETQHLISSQLQKCPKGRSRDLTSPGQLSQGKLGTTTKGNCWATTWAAAEGDDDCPPISRVDLKEFDLQPKDHRSAGCNAIPTTSVCANEVPGRAPEPTAPAGIKRPRPPPPSPPQPCPPMAAEGGTPVCVASFRVCPLSQRSRSCSDLLWVIYLGLFCELLNGGVGQTTTVWKLSLIIFFSF